MAELGVAPVVVEEVEPAGGEDVEPMGMGAFSPCLTVFFEARFRGWVSFLRGLRFVVSISTGRPCWSTTHPRLMNVAGAGAAFAFFLPCGPSLEAVRERLLPEVGALTWATGESTADVGAKESTAAGAAVGMDVGVDGAAMGAGTDATGTEGIGVDKPGADIVGTGTAGKDVVGAGIDDVGAGIDELGAGIDELGAGTDELGTGVDVVSADMTGKGMGRSDIAGAVAAAVVMVGSGDEAMGVLGDDSVVVSVDKAAVGSGEATEVDVPLANEPSSRMSSSRASLYFASHSSYSLSDRRCQCVRPVSHACVTSWTSARDVRLCGAQNLMPGG